MHSCPKQRRALCRRSSILSAQTATLAGYVDLSGDERRRVQRQAIKDGLLSVRFRCCPVHNQASRALHGATATRMPARDDDKRVPQDPIRECLSKGVANFKRPGVAQPMAVPDGSGVLPLHGMAAALVEAARAALREGASHFIYEKKFIFTDLTEAFYTTIKLSFIISIYTLIPFLISILVFCYSK